MINTLEYIHSKCIVYRDVKPDNFMLGLDIDSSKLFLVDYRLSNKYKNPRN
jgi:serine/threonine protein kinase